MIIQLRSYDIDFDGVNVVEKETTTRPITLSKTQIFKEILAAQKYGRLKLNWLDEEPILEKLVNDNFDFISNSDLCRITICDSTFMGGNVHLSERIEIRLIFENAEEYGYYLRMLIYTEFGHNVRNVVTTLDMQHDLFNKYLNSFHIGNYIIVNGVELSKGVGSDQVDVHWYVIQVQDLSNSVITVYAKQEIIPHLIGKGGKKIKETLDFIHKAGYTNVKRINVLPYTKREE